MRSKQDDGMCLFLDTEYQVRDRQSGWCWRKRTTTGNAGRSERELRVEPSQVARTKGSSLGCAGNGPGYENVRCRSVRDVGGLPSPAVANRIRMRKVGKDGVFWRLEDCWMQQPSIRN